MSLKITPDHLARAPVVYIRQSTLAQLLGTWHHGAGSSGTSKTHLAVAIGREAITADYTALFVPAPTLVTQLA